MSPNLNHEHSSEIIAGSERKAGLSRRTLLMSGALGIPLLAGMQGLASATAPSAQAAMSFSAWLQQVDNQALDLDGGPAGNPVQCWDLWAHYATRVLDVPFSRTFTNAGASSPNPGYASNVWHNAAAAGLSSYFTRTGSGTAVAGDAAFWAFGSVYPLSHVAIVIEDRGNALWTMSQDAGGRSRYSLLTKSGLLGYLRPLSSPGVPSTSPTIGQVYESSNTIGWQAVGVANPGTPSVTGSVSSSIVMPDGTKIIYTVRHGEVWEAASSTGWQNLRTGITGVSNDAIAAVVRNGVKIVYTLIGGRVYEAASNAGWVNNATAVHSVSNTALAAIVSGGHTLIYTISGGAVYEASSVNWVNQGTGISNVSNTALSVVELNGTKLIYTVSGGAVYQSASNNGWALQGTGISGVSNTALDAIVDGNNIILYTVRNGTIWEAQSGGGWNNQNTGVVGRSVSAIRSAPSTCVIYAIR